MRGRTKPRLAANKLGDVMEARNLKRTLSKSEIRVLIEKGLAQGIPLDISRKKDNEEFSQFKEVFVEMIRETKDDRVKLTKLSKYGSTFSIQG